MSYALYKEYLDRYYEAFGNSKVFVVAHFSMHTGELTQKLITAIDELAAKNIQLDTSMKTLAEIEDYCASTDQWINAFEINSMLTE